MGQVGLSLLAQPVRGNDLIDRHLHPTDDGEEHQQRGDDHRPHIQRPADQLLDGERYGRDQHSEGEGHQSPPAEAGRRLGRRLGHRVHRRMQGRGSPDHVGHQPDEVEGAGAVEGEQIERRGRGVGTDQQDHRDTEQTERGVPAAGGGDQPHQQPDQQQITGRIGERHRGGGPGALVAQGRGFDQQHPEQQAESDRDDQAVQQAAEVVPRDPAPDQQIEPGRQDRVREQVADVGGRREPIETESVQQPRADRVADHPEQLSRADEVPRKPVGRPVQDKAEADGGHAGQPDQHVRDIALQSGRDQPVADDRHQPVAEEPGPGPPAGERFERHGQDLLPDVSPPGWSRRILTAQRLLGRRNLRERPICHFIESDAVQPRDGRRHPVLQGT